MQMCEKGRETAQFKSGGEIRNFAEAEEASLSRHRDEATTRHAAPSPARTHLRIDRSCWVFVQNCSISERDNLEGREQHEEQST